MAFYYEDAPELTDETFIPTVEASTIPVVVLFWDDTIEVDNSESLAIGLRWLHDGSESKDYYSFFKVNKSVSPKTWKSYKIEGAQICLFSNLSIAESKVGFHYASELNTWLMSKIDKKAAITP